MNFKKYHVSKNLFDPNSTRYHLGKGTSNRVAPLENGAMFCIAAKSNTSYSIKVNTTDATFVRLYLSNAPLVEGTAESYQYIAESETVTNPETTISNTDSTYLWIQVGGTWYTNHGGSSIMLNEGDTALPLEPYGDTWLDSHYIMGTDTDTITTLPADIYANDTTATVGLKGDMSQTGTPSPTTPITPSECGDLTENIWNVTILPNSSITTENYWEKYNSSIVSTTMYMPCLPNTKYYLHTPSNITSGIFRVYTSTTDSIPSEGVGGSVFVYEKIRSSEPISDFEFTTGAGARMLIIQVTTVNSQTMADDATLDKGYKIPILSANTTTPVYLGEVQTVRQIQKVEFTGDTNESWRRTGTGRFAIVLADTSLKSAAGTCLCSHYIGTNKTSIGDISDGECTTRTTDNEFVCYDTAYSTVDTYKAWLAQQYANGTPVTIWYVLATSQTAVVNEPIRKIGTYADTVSGITIPTIAGANTLSIGTTLQPSEVTVNYKGWHPVQSVHEYGGGLAIISLISQIQILQMAI